MLGPSGFTPEEVARIQGISKRAVIQLCYRARKKLEKMLPEGALGFGPLSAPATAEGGAEE